MNHDTEIALRTVTIVRCGDLFDADRLHLNASGYRVFASVIRPALVRG
jgi:lysophospholipase L1-like esterase